MKKKGKKKAFCEEGFSITFNIIAYSAITSKVTFAFTSL